jgi:hypothetical protein
MATPKIVQRGLLPRPVQPGWTDGPAQLQADTPDLQPEEECEPSAERDESRMVTVSPPADNEQVIRCSRCGESLPEDHFAPSHRTQGAWCRDCRRVYIAARYVPKESRPAKVAPPPRLVACPECGVEFRPRYNLNTCSEACRKARRARLQRERGANTTITLGQVLEVAQRDGLNCQLCGESLDLRSRWPAPTSVSVDHVLPRSRGGTDDLTNLQLTHLLCNQRKHNGPASLDSLEATSPP